MRVTNIMMANSVSEQLALSGDRLTRLQTDVASGVRIHRPSDDPDGALRATRLRTGLNYISNYQTAAKSANMWLKGEDVALGQMQDL
ncbi:MAG TPA: hypothetical protein VGM23_17330, partial [Armatimonadota bacterium]